MERQGSPCLSRAASIIVLFLLQQNIQYLPLLMYCRNEIFLSFRCGISLLNAFLHSEITYEDRNKESVSDLDLAHVLRRTYMGFVCIS